MYSFASRIVLRAQLELRSRDQAYVHVGIKDAYTPALAAFLAHNIIVVLALLLIFELACLQNTSFVTAAFRSIYSNCLSNNAYILMEKSLTSQSRKIFKHVVLLAKQVLIIKISNRNAYKRCIEVSMWMLGKCEQTYLGECF